MSPAEALAITDEPDWVEEFNATSKDDVAFETLLTRWRRWHWTPVVYRNEEKKQPAPAVDGIIALAGLGIMPPRTLKDRPPGLFVEQQDDHMWLVTQGRAWRIVAIEDMTMHLDSFGEPRQIDIARARWDKYCEGHAALLEAQMKTPGDHDFAEGSRKEP